MYGHVCVSQAGNLGQHRVGPQTAGHEAARFTPLVFGGSQGQSNQNTRNALYIQAGLVLSWFFLYRESMWKLTYMNLQSSSPFKYESSALDATSAYVQGKVTGWDTIFTQNLYKSLQKSARDHWLQTGSAESLCNHQHMVGLNVWFYSHQNWKQFVRRNSPTKHHSICLKYKSKPSISKHSSLGCNCNYIRLHL